MIDTTSPFSACEAGTNEIYKRTSTGTLDLTVLGIYLVTFCKIQNISHKILAHCSLPRKEVKEDSNNLIDSFRRVEDGEGGGEESAHSCPDGGEVGRVQDVAPVLHRFLDVHVQEDVGPFGSGLLPIVYRNKI